MVKDIICKTDSHSACQKYPAFFKVLVGSLPCSQKPAIGPYPENQNLLIAKIFFENVADFRYLGTMVTNQNCIHEEFKSRLNSVNACYHSVQNLLTSSPLPKNVKIKIHKNSNFISCFV
jgi:hypothetical protein